MNESFHKLRRWSDQLYMWLLVDILASLYVWNATYQVYHHFRQFALGETDLDPSILAQQDSIAALQLNLTLLTLGLFVLYLIWIYWLVKHTNSLSPKKLSLKPRVLIVCHLIIPLVHLVIPLWAMTKIWRVSFLAAHIKRKRSVLAILWWILGVAFFCLTLVTLGTIYSRLEDYLPSLMLSQISLSVRIAFDIVFAVMIRRLMNLQKLCTPSTEPNSKVQCPSCGEMIKSHQTVCPMCGDLRDSDARKLPLP